MVDEAEDSMLGQANKTNKRTLDSPPSSPGPRKRKPGKYYPITLKSVNHNCSR